MRLATDIGGTFTDLVYVDSETGSIGLAKSSSTPPEFAEGIIDAIEKSDLDSAGVEHFVHGTTVVINALTERNGARTALVTTEGCRDVLEIGRANRPDIYNLRFRKQPTFVPRHLRFEITERVNYKGEIVTPVDESQIEGLAQAIQRAEADAVAVVFLHSYANPDHEQLVASRLRDRLPNVLVTPSSDITREWREYERTSTAVLNAYVQPTAASYLASLQDRLREQGIVAPLSVMKSNGGTATFEMSAAQPIHMVESGPVGGVIGAAAVGDQIGNRNLITLDIGGTTAKCSLIEEGEVKVTTEYRIERDAISAGYPIKVPVVDIVEIGAGGGSIAWVDAGGALKIGPRSAGARPGPACYGTSGTEPTVTDANLIAGRINPNYFLGGEINLDVSLAEKAHQPIADALGVSVRDAALGVIRLANSNMINALKLVSVRRGHDPRDFTLVAFGGGGAMHAAALAHELHIGEVIVPVAPGHFSAWGMLVSDAAQDFIRTLLTTSSEDRRDRIEAMFTGLTDEASEFFRAVDPEDSMTMVRNLDMRYHGQEHTVRVPVPDGPIEIGPINDLFHELHERAYTFQLDSQVEIVNFHLTAIVPVDKPRLVRPSPVTGVSAEKGVREVDYDELGRHSSQVFERSALGGDQVVSGPAIIEEEASTTVVYPGMTARLDEIGNIVIDTGVAG